MGTRYRVQEGTEGLQALKTPQTHQRFGPGAQVADGSNRLWEQWRRIHGHSLTLKGLVFVSLSPTGNAQGRWTMLTATLFPLQQAEDEPAGPGRGSDAQGGNSGRASVPQKVGRWSCGGRDEGGEEDQERRGMMRGSTFGEQWTTRAPLGAVHALMTQHFKTPWSLHESCKEENENFIPFVTCSKMVNRCEGQAEPSPLCPPPLGTWGSGVDLEGLSQQGRPHLMEMYDKAPLPLLSGHAAERPDARLDASCPNSGLMLERLPSPRELYGRRRGRDRSHRQRPVLAVTCHLEELKRRQSCIDQLKALKWGGCRTQGLAAEAEESLTDQERQQNDCPGITDFPNSSDLEDREPFFHPRWSFGVQKQCPIPTGIWCPTTFSGEAEERLQVWGLAARPLDYRGILWREQWQQAEE
ncbi:uncharacterized protein [Narcine bancroftii]|uniref:uncharacterized protein n=1 Tax=Narcine bancroftii TaxID=1343680 RepID=UPI003832326E